MKIKRYAGESDIKYIVRACDNKTTETWDELAHEINKELGREQTSSSYRKMYQYYNIVKDAVKDESIEEQIAELEEKRAELEKEKKKLSTLNIERNRVGREDARRELFFEQVADYVKYAEMPKLKYDTNNNVSTKLEWVQTIADIHYGAEFSINTNEYSPKIAKDRFEILLGETAKFVKANNVKKLTVVLEGDAIQGILRTTDISLNSSSIVKASVEVANLISAYVNELSAYCEVELYDVVYGNHSQIRPIGTKANELPYEDLGYLISTLISTTLASNERVRVHIPEDGATEIEIKGIHDFNIIATHGHLIKSKKNYLANLAMQNRKFYDYALLGHFHQEEILSNGTSGLANCKTLVSPSFIGDDPYGIQFGSNKAGVNMYGFHKTYGHIKTETIILN